MSGHGWVVPNPGGVVARCGGPALCSVCRAEQAKENGQCERHGETACPSCLTYDNADLKRQLTEALAELAHAKQYTTTDWVLLRAAERDEARAQVAALREALEACDVATDWADVEDAVKNALSDTARAAAEHDARVRDAALEEAAAFVSALISAGRAHEIQPDAIRALKGNKP